MCGSFKERSACPIFGTGAYCVVEWDLNDQAFSRARVRVVRSQTSLGPKY